MRFRIVAQGPGVGDGGTESRAGDVGAALALVGTTRRRFPQADVRVVDEDGRRFTEADLVRLAGAREAAALRRSGG